MQDIHARDEELCSPVFDLGLELVTWNRVRIVLCCLLAIPLAFLFVGWEWLHDACARTRRGAGDEWWHGFWWGVGLSSAVVLLAMGMLYALVWASGAC